MNKCYCCDTPAEYSILLAFGPNSLDGNEDRVYLPNQYARGAKSKGVRATWFCKPCMRALEDNFRATLESRKSQQGAPCP